MVIIAIIYIFSIGWILNELIRNRVFIFINFYQFKHTFYHILLLICEILFSPITVIFQTSDIIRIILKRKQ